MPLRFQCSFCGLGIDPGELDPCEVTIDSSADCDPADRRTQTIYGHYACLRRVTTGVLQLTELSTPRLRAEEDEAYAATLFEFFGSWVASRPEVVPLILRQQRGTWARLQDLDPGIGGLPEVMPDPGDIRVSWAEDPEAGQRMLDVPRALLLFHDGHAVYHVLVKVPPAEVPDPT